MGTTFAPGQLAELSSTINIGVATALPNLAKKYDPKVLLKALEGRGQVFAGRLEVALEQALNSMLVLAPRGATTITLAERHDPNTFYRTRPGLYVWDNFRPRVVAKARPGEAGISIGVEYFDLMQQLTNEEIESALPNVHIFDETQVCAAVAGLITRQSNGEEGALVNNGFAGLFYMDSCVVRVRWNGGYREWLVGAWKRGGTGCRAGNRVFSPGN